MTQDSIPHRSWIIYENDFRAHPDWRKVRWLYSHQDFDGAEDSGDSRCGAMESVEACKAEIDEWELSNPEKVYDRTWNTCITCSGSGAVKIEALNGAESQIFCEDCLGYGGWFR